MRPPQPWLVHGACCGLALKVSALNSVAHRNFQQSGWSTAGDTENALAEKHRSQKSLGVALKAESIWKSFFHIVA